MARCNSTSGVCTTKLNNILGKVYNSCRYLFSEVECSPTVSYSLLMKSGNGKFHPPETMGIKGGALQPLYAMDGRMKNGPQGKIIINYLQLYAKLKIIFGFPKTRRNFCSKANFIRVCYATHVFTSAHDSALT